MWRKQTQKSVFRESIKALEADIHHANTLAAALPRDCIGEFVQMKLSYGPFAPFMLFLIEWLDYSCKDILPSYLGLLHILVYKVCVVGNPTMSSQQRKVTLKEFYSIIHPLLQQLEDDMTKLMENNSKKSQSIDTSRKMNVEKEKFPYKGFERDDECGICMETCTKMVLPNCGHSICMNCFHEWNLRSQSCPYCRGNLKRVSSRDLWVVVADSDALDIVTLAKENLGRFYRYIETLPPVFPDANVIVYDYMI